MIVSRGCNCSRLYVSIVSADSIFRLAATISMPASRYKLCAFLPYASVPMKPRRNRLSIYIFAFCGFLNVILCLDPSASVTIAQLPAWSMQRSCGKGCLQNTYDPGADIEGVLGCSWNGCVGPRIQPFSAMISRRRFLFTMSIVSAEVTRRRRLRRVQRINGQPCNLIQP